MKTSNFRHSNTDYENENHIARKKKATAKKLVKFSVREKQNEYGIEDEKEMLEYERFIK